MVSLSRLLPHFGLAQPTIHASSLVLDLSLDTPEPTDQATEGQMRASGFFQAHGLRRDLRFVSGSSLGARLSNSSGVNFCCAPARPTIALAEGLMELDPAAGQWLAIREAHRVRTGQHALLRVGQALSTLAWGGVTRAAVLSTRLTAVATAPWALIADLIFETQVQTVTYRIGAAASNALLYQFAMASDRYAIAAASPELLAAGRRVLIASHRSYKALNLSPPPHDPDPASRLGPVEAVLQEVGLLDALQQDPAEERLIERLARFCTARLDPNSASTRSAALPPGAAARSATRPAAAARPSTPLSAPLSPAAPPPVAAPSAASHPVAPPLAPTPAADLSPAAPSPVAELSAASNPAAPPLAAALPEALSPEAPSPVAAPSADLAPADLSTVAELSAASSPAAPPIAATLPEALGPAAPPPVAAPSADLLSPAAPPLAAALPEALSPEDSSAADASSATLIPTEPPPAAELSAASSPAAPSLAAALPEALGPAAPSPVAAPSADLAPADLSPVAELSAASSLTAPPISAALSEALSPANPPPVAAPSADLAPADLSAVAAAAAGL